jgi:membrane fusion protein (multidrug efflux system)
VPSRTSASFKAIATLAVTAVSIASPVAAQHPTPVPAVGVVEVVKRPITERSEFLGRIEAVERVNVVARLNAFLDKRLFKEGDEVKANDLLYRLQRGPFEADLQARKAQVAQLEATLANARITTDRQQTLLKSPAGLQSSYDSAIANQKSLEAQLQAAQAQVSLSEISLGYADIRSPIDGKIDRTAVTEGNVVGPGSGTLTTIVSQDPMYVTFPISVREALALRERYAAKGGADAVVIRVKLPDGRIYGQTGHLNFASNSITRTTDTILVRGTISNPSLYPGRNPVRELTDGELVTVMLEGAQPVEVLAIPRAAVLTDQQGNYVLIVGADNKVEQRRIKTGQSTTTVASVASGLSLGDRVIVEGIQNAKPGQVVAAGAASAAVQAAMKQSALSGPGGAPAVQPTPASSTRGLNR